jgi:hypothetical protein
MQKAFEVLLVNFSHGTIVVNATPVRSGTSVNVTSLQTPIITDAARESLPFMSVYTALFERKQGYMRRSGTRDVFFRVTNELAVDIILYVEHVEEHKDPGVYVFNKGVLTYNNAAGVGGAPIPLGFTRADVPTCAPSYSPHSQLFQDTDPMDYKSAAQVFAAMRMHGTPAARRMAAGQGENTPVRLETAPDGKRTLVPARAPLVSRGLASGRTVPVSDAYKYMGTGVSSGGRFVAAPRQHHWKGMAFGKSSEQFGELVNTRVRIPTSMDQARMTNLVPRSIFEENRKEAVTRLRKITDAYVAARLRSVL